MRNLNPGPILIRLYGKITVCMYMVEDALSLTRPDFVPHILGKSIPSGAVDNVVDITDEVLLASQMQILEDRDE